MTIPGMNGPAFNGPAGRSSRLDSQGPFRPAGPLQCWCYPAARVAGTNHKRLVEPLHHPGAGTTERQSHRPEGCGCFLFRP
jgi:hypothetical protein